jgi:DNA mismatch repair protein MutL
MSDVIQLLPERVANQIAAGEVVQRPSSVVKELLENAIDAGSTRVQLIIRDGGKTLIQVIDNGCGMSETDARMSFERHATSKIRDAQDLFAIRTMGFRGEALASIAAVAQVEMRTRRLTEELGTRILVEDSVVVLQEACQHTGGTSVAVRNLFYNVPARRNFLKGDTVEMRHIVDEFQRVSMAHPDLNFFLHHNDQELFHLPSGNQRQRVVKLFGDSINKKLVPVQETTDVLAISGFVGKPDYFRKGRGEQFFFVNRRFIKSSYLHHAVVASYEDLMPADAQPLYVLFLDIDPSRIDINVHPTKTEIKFDDEKLVYNYLRVTVRHALGTHNITPTLDFETEPAFQPHPLSTVMGGGISGSISGGEGAKLGGDRQRNNLEHWQKMYEGISMYESGVNRGEVVSPSMGVKGLDYEGLSGSGLINSGEMVSGGGGRKEPYQIHGQFIMSPIKSGFLLIDQHAASERILYERYLSVMDTGNAPVQRVLFPRTVEVSPGDAVLLRDILVDINNLGFDIQEFGGNSFVIHGIPSGLGVVQEEVLLERVMNQYKDNLELDLGIRDNLARSMARSAAIRRGQVLCISEMEEVIDQLFACSIPGQSPGGRRCFVNYDMDELQRRFQN